MSPGESARGGEEGETRAVLAGEAAVEEVRLLRRAGPQLALRTAESAEPIALVALEATEEPTRATAPEAATATFAAGSTAFSTISAGTSSPMSSCLLYTSPSPRDRG